jgi:hypothetical protein
VVVFGVVVLFFFVWSLVAWRRSSPPEPGLPGTSVPGFALLLAGGHLLVLMLLAWEAVPFGRSIGFLRHLVTSAPAFALVAAWGVERWWGTGPGWHLRRGVFLGVWTAVTAAFLSHELIGHSLRGEGTEPWRWIATGLVGVAAWGAVAFGLPLRAGAGVLALAQILMTLSTVHPIPLDPERQAVAKALQYLQEQGLDRDVVYTNHPWFAFLSGRDRYDERLTPRLTRAGLERAPAGSLVLWDNHYGPRLEGDVPVEALRNDPRFTRILELSAGKDANFKVVVFRRTV